MDTLWIQINLRSFINQMDASSWFMTPFWFKCRFFCNVVGLWRRYKYFEDISKLYLVITMVGAFLTSDLEVEQSLDIYACGAPANSVSLKFWTTHLNLENIYWNKIFCGWMCLVIWPVVWLVAGLRVGALPHGELLLGLGHGEAAPADRVPDQQRVRVIQPPLDTRYINIDI